MGPDDEGGISDLSTSTSGVGTTPEIGEEDHNININHNYNNKQQQKRPLQDINNLWNKSFSLMPLKEEPIDFDYPEH